MDTPSPARLWLTLVVIAGVVLAGGAIYLTVTQGDAVSPLFRHVLTIQVITGLLVWFLLAWAARRSVVGALPKARVDSKAALIWGGSRVALLIATVTVMVCWLAALAFGLALETAFVRAVVLLVVVTAFTGIIGGAFLNSMLAVGQWRVRKSE